MKKAKQATAALYDGDFAALSSLSQTEMKSIFTGAKVQDILLEPGMTVLDLVLKAKIYKHDRMFLFCIQCVFDLLVLMLMVFFSNIFAGEATRLISQGGFYINQNRCTNIAEVISPTVHILANKYTLLRTGSRNYYIISWKN